MRHLPNLFTTLLVLAATLSAQGDIFYANDFQDPNDPLTEWSHNPTATTPGTVHHPADRFLGPFQSKSTALTLTGLPPRSMITVAFDLYIIGSWDGHAAGSGPDIWSLSPDGGPVLLRTTFSNTGNPQTYPDAYPGGSFAAGTGAVEKNTLGYPINSPPYGDSVYHFPNSHWEFTFDHTGDTVAIVFSSQQTETHPDEVWGLDNVVVTVVCSTPPVNENFRDGAPAYEWESIGNGEWIGDPAQGDGIFRQIHGPVDDNLSALKLLSRCVRDFEMTVRWRQDAGPIISSGMEVWFRAGDEPGPGANVPGLGPHYYVGWAMTPAHYGHPDFWIGYAEGFKEVTSNVYWRVDGQTLGHATLNTPTPWYGLHQWRRTRIVVEGDLIRAYIDRDSRSPDLDRDDDFELACMATDTRLTGGTVVLNDHYARSSWDYVRVIPQYEAHLAGDLNCDGVVDFGDINPFVLAISQWSAYRAHYPECPERNADVNGDGVYGGQWGFGDINPFVELLTNP